MILAILAAATVLSSDLDRLGWMTGAWVQKTDDSHVQETWLTPTDGVMAGVSQTRRAGQKPFIEYMKISVEPEGLTFTAMIPGQPPKPFVLKPGGDGEAVFENPGHDFPQRVIYRRCGPDLCARIEGTLQGKAQLQDWRYTRVRQ